MSPTVTNHCFQRSPAPTRTRQVSRRSVDEHESELDSSTSGCETSKSWHAKTHGKTLLHGKLVLGKRSPHQFKPFITNGMILGNHSENSQKLFKFHSGPMKWYYLAPKKKPSPMFNRTVSYTNHEPQKLLLFKIVQSLGRFLGTRGEHVNHDPPFRRQGASIKGSMSLAERNSASLPS